MSWEDRIKPAAYTSPSGKRYKFDYEDVSKSWDKKTSSYNFADANGTYVQDLGRTGRRLPMKFFFWGENYDVAANNFENALAEKGSGILEHPVYGRINVVPFGTINRKDSIVSEGNQAVIECDLFETTNLIYPSAQGDPETAVAESITNFRDSASKQFSTALNISSKVKQALAKNAVIKALKAFKVGLQKVAAIQADVQKTFDAVFDSINDGMDTLIGAPLTLAFQTQIMIGAPARAFGLLADKLEAYGNLARSIFGKDKKGGADVGRLPSLDDSIENGFIIDHLFASSAVCSMAAASVSNVFSTKKQVLEAAESILTINDELNTWNDLNTGTLEAIDTGGSYQALQRVIALVAGYLVEISFTLLQERRITLDRPRNFIELCAELYQETDAKLDFFLQSNALTGSEIWEIPTGREIVYYV